MNGGNRIAGQCLQPGKDLVGHFNTGLCHFAVSLLFKFADIRAGDKAAGFRRINHQPGGQCRFQLRQDGIQFLHHVTVQGVDTLIATVDGQPGNIFVIPLQLPVLVRRVIGHR